MTDGRPQPSGPGRKGRRQILEERAQARVAEFEAQVRARRAQLDALEERIEKRTGRNLPLAITIGLVMGFAMLFSLIVAPQYFMLVAGALTAFAVFELATALRSAGYDVPRLPSVVAGLAIVPATFYGQGQGQWLALLAGVALVTVWRLVEQVRPSTALSPERIRAGGRLGLTADIGAGILVQVYVSLLGSFSVLLASQPVDGHWWTLAFLIVVIATDTGAYASGLLFGRHAMAPRISPKKTWEGFLGSVTVAVVTGIVLSYFMIDVPWWVGLVFGAVIVVTSTLGDLAESMIKRDVGVKDISGLLPGHGGFLDRVDSVLPSAVAAWGMFLLFA